MLEKFKIYYEPSESDFIDLWNNAIIIFDTNTILNLFRYPKSVRNDFIKIIEQINTRIWIPHQVALEYHENKHSVKNEQIGKYSDVNKLIDKLNLDLNLSLKMFKDEIDKLKLKRRHIDINPELVIEKISDTIETTSKQINKFKKFEYSNNAVVEQEKIQMEFLKLEKFLTKTFNDKIGECPENQNILDDYYKEAQRRFSLLIPPGFEDMNKSKDSNIKVYMHNGLIFKREYGDFILWKEIIKKSQEKNCKYLIFVTDDNKKDWWEIQSGQTIGGRKELYDEIYVNAHSDFKMFYMYNSWRFMTFAKDFLKIEVESSSIEQIKLFEEINIGKNQSIAKVAYYSESEFLKYLRQQYPYDDILTEINHFDCIRIDNKTKKTIAYETKLFYGNDKQRIKIRLKQTFNQYDKEILKNIDELVFVIIGFENADFNLTEIISDLKMLFPDWCTYLFAKVEKIGDEFYFEII
jgi:hypothetical protein